MTSLMALSAGPTAGRPSDAESVFAGVVALGGLLARQHAHYLCRIPCATACRWYAALIQSCCNGPQ